MTRRLSSLAVAMATAGALAACGGAKESTSTTTVPVTGVTLKAATALTVGGTEQLTAVLTPTNASDPRLTWTTSSPSVATVTPAVRGVGQAVVTAVAAGEATITATTADGRHSAACRVTVTVDSVAVTGVTIAPAEARLTVGGTVALDATVAPSGATRQTVTWSASNTHVELSATEGSAVTVTARAVGAAVVTARTQDGGFTSAAQITVLPVGVTGVAVAPKTLALTSGAPDGTSGQLTATISPSNATYQSVSWVTSDSSVATITTTGPATATVLAHRPGTALITVTTTDGGKSDTCQVKVTDPTAPVVAVTGVSLDRAPTAVLDLEAGSPGTSGVLVATVSPATATNQNVSWTSSDPGVAVLSATAGSAVTVTGAAAGTATITAITESGAKTASTGVKVWLLDAQIAATTASGSFWARADAPGYFSTKAPGASNYDEVAAGKLRYYADDKGFRDGDADGGIQLNYYASGSATDPVVRGATPTAKAYVGIPAARTATTAPSVRILVTAKALGGSPRIALTLDGRVLAVSDVLTGAMADYAFDGVPRSAQIDVLDGGPDGSSLAVRTIRVEPSSTAPVDATPPGPVTGLTATASGSAVTLGWTNPTDADLAYLELSYGAPAVITTVASTATGATVTGLTAGTAYTFTVKAVDAGGLASSGVSVTATTPFDPLLDETISVDPAVVDTAVDNSPGALVSVDGSRLQYFARTKKGTANAHFKRQDGKLMFAESTVDPATIATTYDPTTATTTVTGKNPKAYVSIPAAYTTPPSSAFPSVKVIVRAAQANTSGSMSLLLLDGTPPPHTTSTGPKILARAPVPLGASTGAAVTTFVFDGVTPGAALKLGCDLKQLFLVGVRVEPSTTAAGTPIVSVR